MLILGTMDMKELSPLVASSEEAARFLQTLGNPNRLIILCKLLDAEEMSVTALQEGFDITQSALSQHLARMREEGLITYRREAQTLYYSIADEKVRNVIMVLKDNFCPKGNEFSTHFMNIQRT